jgi:hypothetical protein
MNKRAKFGLTLLILLCLVLSSCNINGARTVTETSSSIVASTSTMSSLTTSISLGDEITEWKSTMLASESNIVFGSGVGATIAGKNYLICTVDFGNNPEGTGTNADAGIIISDISNPDNPEEISYLKTGLDKQILFEGNLKLIGTTLYALMYDPALPESYLWIIDVSDPDNPKDLGKTALAASFDSDIEVSGNYAYIVFNSYTNGNQTISTFDISDPTNPRSVGEITIPIPGFFNALKLSGSLLFAMDYDGLYIFNASIPSSLKQIGFLANPFPPLTGVIPPEYIPPDFFDMALAGNDLYIVSGIDRLLVVDVSTPTNPKIIGNFEMQEQGTNIIVSGNRAYLLSCNGSITFSEGVENLLAVVDISNPGNLKEFNSVLLSPTYSESYSNLIETDNRLYFCDDRYPSILIIDLQNLADSLK